VLYPKLKCLPTQLQAYLTPNGCSVETVTIIRERSSGTCTFVSVYGVALTSPCHWISKVLRKASALRNFQPLNTHGLLWIPASRSFKCLPRLRMGLPQRLFFTRPLKLVLRIMGEGSKSIIPRVPRRTTEDE
jgi:hypothetical protein